MPKLVRDKIPQIIASQGRIPITRTLNLEDYQQALIDKLIEEIDESNQDRNLEELADIIEVFDAIVLAYGFTPGELSTVRAKKKLERGGFGDMIWLEKIV